LPDAYEAKKLRGVESTYYIKLISCNTSELVLEKKISFSVSPLPVVWQCTASHPGTFATDPK
jgi:hypothetical protein